MRRAGVPSYLQELPCQWGSSGVHEEGKEKSGGGIKGEKKQEKRWAGGTSRKEKDKECNQFLV